MKCLTSKASCFEYLTRINTSLHGREENSYTVCCPQSQLQHYTKTLAFIWLISHRFGKTLLWFSRSQHVSRSALAVTLTAAHESKMCSLSKRRLLVAQKWGSMKLRSAVTCSFTSYKMTMDPLAQAFNGGVRDLAAQTLPFLCVHHLKDTPQLFQEVKSSQATHERRSGGLAIKHAVRVVQSLGAWWTAEKHTDLQGVLRKIYHSFWFTSITINQ